MTNVTKILPSCFTEISVEHILHTYNRTPKIIYLSLLTLIIAGFASLFFIKIDVHVQARGVIKTMGDRVYPKASGSGYVQYLNPLLHEHAQVEAGDTLIIIGRQVWDEQLQHAQHREEELKNLLVDLEVLVSLPFKEQGALYDEIPVFRTDVYRQNHQLFCSRYQNNFQEFLMVQKSFEREKLLFDKQVIASADFEQAEHEYNKVVLGLTALYREQMNQWRQEQLKYKDEQIELHSKIIQLKAQKQELTILAPVTGSVQQFPGHKIGNYLTEGEILMEISPDGLLLAECYLTPRDIGLIQNGQQALIRIDAFNYNEWGMLKTEVVDIAQDVTFLDGQAFFKVFCSHQKNGLSLKNGYTGMLKKGMTFSISFKLTRRTLFQWLYDKTDHWLNPNIIA